MQPLCAPVEAESCSLMSSGGFPALCNAIFIMYQQAFYITKHKIIQACNLCMFCCESDYTLYFFTTNFLSSRSATSLLACRLEKASLMKSRYSCKKRIISEAHTLAVALVQNPTGLNAPLVRGLVASYLPSWRKIL